MAIEILVPRLGWSMDEGTFSKWLKQEGELVQEGDALFELESDKATQEVESFDGGILRLSADAPQPGEVVVVGQCLGYLCEPDEPLPAAGAPTEQAGSGPQVEVPAEPASPQVSQSDPPASPSARRLARKLGVDIRQLAGAGNGRSITEEDVRAAATAHADPLPQKNGSGQSDKPRQAVSPRAAARAVELDISLSGVTGTGRGGRIRERDVMAAVQGTVARQPAAGTQTEQSHVHEPATAATDRAASQPTVPGLSFRKTIAERMVAATQQSAQVTLMVKTDVTELLGLREEFKSASKLQKIEVPSITGMFTKLVAAALQHHPQLVHQWTDGGIVVPDGVHIAVAVDTEHGLLAPVLRNVPELPIAEITRQLPALIQRARARQLTPAELQGGTFTLSNLGGYAVDGFTPILNLPQSAILGIGRISREPIVVGDKIVVGDQVSLSLTFDHRVHDGAPAADFLQTVCEILKQPGPWLMQ